MAMTRALFGAAPYGNVMTPETLKALNTQHRGKEKPSYRDMLGSPRPKNPAAVY